MKTARRWNRANRSRWFIGVLVALVAVAAPPDHVPAQSAAPRSPIELRSIAEDHLRRGRATYRRDELERAVDAARSAIEVNPRYAAAYVVLGEAHLWLESYEAAAADFADAHRFGYRGVDLALLQGQLAVLTGRYEDARQRYRSVLDREPYNEDARVGVALLDLVDGVTPSVNRELRRLADRFPENRRLLIALVELSARRGDDDALRRYLDIALRYHGDSASVQLIAAERALADGAISQAEFHARNAVGIAPDFAEAWLVLAEAAFRAGKPEEARTHYESLIRIEPENHLAWYARGAVAAENGDRRTAVQSWRRAAEIRPDFELPRIARE